MSEPTLTLFADCLLSKWGFGDGDVPDAYLDWCDDNGHPYPGDWHTVLRTLVRTRLVPALHQRVEVVDIETSHNPIRAERVDGVDVRDWWRNTDSGMTLTPECVEVPYAEVLATYLADPASLT